MEDHESASRPLTRQRRDRTERNLIPSLRSDETTQKYRITDPTAREEMRQPLFDRASQDRGEIISARSHTQKATETYSDQSQAEEGELLA